MAMECEAAASAEECGERYEMSRVRGPVLLEIVSCQCWRRRRRSSIGTEVVRGGRSGRQHTRNRQGNRLQGLRGAQAQERTATATIRQEKGLDGISTEWACRECMDLLLGTALPSLVLADVAVIDERVCGGEGTAGAAECVARCVL